LTLGSRVQAHPFGAFAISLFGVGYWYVWAVWVPRRGVFRREREVVRMDDGVSRVVFRKVYD